MRIEQYIKELLYRYECVIVPGFGAFLAHRKPAEIHESTHAFYPPKKVISFNKQLAENDGVLVNYVAKAEDISYSEASQKVNAFAQGLMSSLTNENEVVLDGIGTFLYKEQKILFQPFYHTNYLLDAFGMSSFIAEGIKREPEKETTPKVIPLENSSTNDTNEEKQKPNYLKYAAIGIIAIGVSGFLGANWYTQEVKNHNLAAQQNAESQVNQKIQEATFVIDAPLPEITFNVTTKSGKYHIVAGAFRNEENAHKKLTLLKEKGFKAREIGANKYGLHQVIYDSYKNRLEALQALREIKQNENKAAWLLVKEL